MAGIPHDHCICALLRYELAMAVSQPVPPGIDRNTPDQLATCPLTPIKRRFKTPQKRNKKECLTEPTPQTETSALYIKTYALMPPRQ